MWNAPLEAEKLLAQHLFFLRRTRHSPQQMIEYFAQTSQEIKAFDCFETVENLYLLCYNNSEGEKLRILGIFSEDVADSLIWQYQQTGKIRHLALERQCFDVFNPDGLFKFKLDKCLFKLYVRRRKR